MNKVTTNVGAEEGEGNLEAIAAADGSSAGLLVGTGKDTAEDGLAGCGLVAGWLVGAVESLNKVDASEEKYARLLKRLRRHWDEEDARKHQRRAEAARALMHAEQRQQLAKRLAADFQHRMQDKAVPEFVQRFV